MSQDNVLMPIATPFTLRSKDVSLGGDGTLQAHLTLARLYPMDWSLNGVTGGMFARTGKSGTMAAGLAAAAPIFALQWTSATLLSALRRVKLAAWSTGTGFTAGLATFDMYVARAFSVQDSGGTAATLTGHASKLRTAMSSSAASIMRANTGALTPGTRTLDPDPIESWSVAAPTAANTPFNATPMKLFEKLPGEHPLLLAQNEGCVIAATVPATGTWQFAVGIEWDELPLF